jgi:hypothetical protein
LLSSRDAQTARRGGPSHYVWVLLARRLWNNTAMLAGSNYRLRVEAQLAFHGSIDRWPTAAGEPECGSSQKGAVAALN